MGIPKQVAFEIELAVANAAASGGEFEARVGRAKIGQAVISMLKQDGSGWYGADALRSTDLGIEDRTYYGDSLDSAVALVSPAVRHYMLHGSTLDPKRFWDIVSRMVSK